MSSRNAVTDIALATMQNRERGSDAPSIAGGATPVVSFKDVSKTFDLNKVRVEAVRDVNLDVCRGEFVTIVGPSGCGKSTLLNMTAGILEPTTGIVSYDGKQVTGLNLRVGYMTQNDHLLPWRDVVGNIGLPLEIQGASRSEIKQKGRRPRRSGRSDRL